MNINNINPAFAQQQAGQVTKSPTLRNAARSEDLPKLTQDESSLINKKFTSGNNKSMNLYSVDGQVSEQTHFRGQNIDTRI